jgi:hypothetical protein
MLLSSIKRNPNNPRTIRDERFQQLQKSIQDFPQMMTLRPIIVDDDGMVLGGNMRLDALLALGLVEVPDAWVRRASDLTDDQKKEFTVKDNASFGQWDWAKLEADWSDVPLAEWGALDLGQNHKTNALNTTDEWVGMPEFEPGKTPYKIVVNFDDEKTREQFAADHQLAFMQKESTAWITWFPFRERADRKSLKYEPVETDN